MTTPWDTGSSQCQVLINGVAHGVQTADPFGSTIRALAAGKGYNKFTVIVDGKELDPGKSPDTFEGLKKVEIKKYDEAA